MRYSLWSFLYLLSLIYQCSSLALIEVSLNSTIYVPARGSTQGGTLIYLKGSGFIHLASQYLVLIGPYPCVNISLLSSSSISCFTTKTNVSNVISMLSTTIQVSNNSFQCNSSSCLYSYSDSLTPIIQEICPRSACGNQSVYIFGSHRITQISSPNSKILQIKIGNENCILQGVSQNLVNIAPNSRWPIKCLINPLQIAGQYSFVEQVAPGFAWGLSRIYQTSYFTKLNYTQRIVPQISSISSHMGGIKGHILKLQGTGFSPNLSNYSCQISGQLCQVIEISANLSQVTIMVPPKSTLNTNYGKLVKQISDQSIQTNPYLGGNGALYRRYNRSSIVNSFQGWLQVLRSGPNLTLLQQKVIKQLQSPQVYGSDYLEYIRGYFLAPVDGAYEFNIVGDDYGIMQISPIRNNSNLTNLQLLVKHDEVSASRYNPYVKPLNNSITSINLTAGYHYFEILTINGGGAGHYKVSVSMPSIYNYTTNPTWQMSKIVMKASQIQPQIIKVTVFAASGTFELYYNESATVLRKMAVAVGSTAIQFQNLLVNLPNINACKPTVTLITLDANGNPTVNAGLIMGYEYSITMFMYRPPTTSLPNTNDTALVAGAVPTNLSVTRVQNHSPRLSGYFSLLIDGVQMKVNDSTNISYYASAFDLQIGLRSVPSLRNIEAMRVYGVQAQISIEILIQFIGYFGSPQLSVNTTYLTGGKVGSVITNQISILRQYSSKEIYSPIPYEFLNLASSLPSLRLSVNSIPAACMNCSYSFISSVAPLIQNFSRTQDFMFISLIDSGSIGFNTSDLNITYLGVPCSNITENISNLSCILPLNSDSSVMLPAGTEAPKVHVNQVGFADVNSNITLQTIRLNVYTVIPNQASLVGGEEVTIFGEGFPINSANGLYIQICGNPVTIISSVSNQIIKFVNPIQIQSCTDNNSFLSYNGQSSKFQFYYNPCFSPKDQAKCSALYMTNDQREPFLRLWSNLTQWPNHILPAIGQNVFIPYQWNLILDIDPPILGLVEINGILNFDRSRNTTFQAHYIWINEGIIKVGSENLPFFHQANFILHGAKKDVRLVIDTGVSGNKLIAVTGGLQLFGNKPTTVWTRLTKNANVGDLKINVQSISGWKIGDNLVIGPSYSGPSEHEEISITNITGKQIQLSSSLQYEHFGDSSLTLDNSYGKLDTRSAVGLLTRNIKIMGSQSPDNWGCRLLVYGRANDNPTNHKKGYAKIKGVEFDGCGQPNTNFSALRLESIGISASNYTLTQLIENSIHRCKGYCLFVKNSSNVDVTNNIFFFARNYLVYIDQLFSNFSFANNLLIGAVQNDLIENQQSPILVDIAAYAQYKPFNSFSQIVVKNNVVQGSQGQGFAFSMLNCSFINDYPFINNIAGSCKIAFLYNQLNNSECTAVKGSIGYASQIGVQANMYGALENVQYSDLFLADCGLSLSLKFSHGGSGKKMIISNSFFTGVSKPNCLSCYSQNKINYCRNANVIKMSALKAISQLFPFDGSALNQNDTNSSQTFYSKAYLQNIKFQNYRRSYNLIGYCQNMSVFKSNNEVIDSMLAYFLTNVSCLNCQPQSLVSLEMNSSESKKLIIFDQDKTFFKNTSQFISNLSSVTNSSICTFNSSLNGYLCQNNKSVILDFQLILNQFSFQTEWPTFIRLESSSQIKQLNAWKYSGQKSGLTKMILFWSTLLQANQSYQIKFKDRVTSDITFQMRQISSSQNGYVIITIDLPVLNSFEILIKNGSVSDILVKPQIIINQTKIDLSQQNYSCGANYVNSTNGEVTFVLKKQDCQVRVRISSFILLTIQLNLDLEFFLQTNLTQKIAFDIRNFCGVDKDQIKILSITQSNNNIEMKMMIQTKSSSLSYSKYTKKDTKSQYFMLFKINKKLSSFLNEQVNAFDLISHFQHQLYVFNVDGSLYTPQFDENIQQAQQLTLGVPLIITLLLPFVLLIYSIKDCRKNRQILIQQIKGKNIFKVNRNQFRTHKVF